MDLNDQVTPFGKSEDSSPDMSFTLVFREVPEEKIFVAECLEIPGCVSEGETLAEAEANIRDAVRACLSVMFEDCVRDATKHRSISALKTGALAQHIITVRANPGLDLQVA